MYENKNIIEATYEEVAANNEETKDNLSDAIEPTYYTTKQVADIIDEPDSTVRYWTRYFEKHLELTYSNKNRAFVKQDVNRLLQIKSLKERGMTLKQIDEYFLNNGFESESGELDTKNPLAIETFMSALTSEMDKKMEVFQNEMRKQIIASMAAMEKLVLEGQKKTHDEFEEQIALTIDEAITDKLDEFKGDLKASVDELGDNVSNKVEDSLKTASISSETIDSILDTNKNLVKTVEELKNKQLESYEQQERTNDIIARLKLSLEESKIKAQQEEVEKQENKGFFSRLFGK